MLAGPVSEGDEITHQRQAERAKASRREMAALEVPVSLQPAKPAQR
jgi:hypothetical protein